jgi:hypothetical protein
MMTLSENPKLLHEFYKEIESMIVSLKYRVKHFNELDYTAFQKAKNENE